MSMHWDVPVAQDVRPVWHALSDGVHTRLARQDVHTPPLQTWFVPQDVPFGMNVDEPVHVATPFAHDVTVPFSQPASAGVHEASTVQVLHTPP